MVEQSETLEEFVKDRILDTIDYKTFTTSRYYALAYKLMKYEYKELNEYDELESI